jgi:hypothetical protein
MPPRFPSGLLPHVLTVLLVILSPLTAQTLLVQDDVVTRETITGTVITLAGRGELLVTGSGDPLPGCTVNFQSPDAWLRLPSVLPSAVQSTLLSRFRVHGANAALGTNLRIVQHTQGAVVMAHGDDFPALEGFDARYFAGRRKPLHPYADYDGTSLGRMNQALRSFRLRRGYMATLATEENGTGTSRVYIAQDGDLEVGRLPDSLDASVRFVRVFPWRWVSKKGFAGNIGGNLRPAWWYNWNLDQNATLNREYVAIRQNRWWPGLNQDWKTRGINHLLGYNEPDHPDQANLSVSEAIAGWPDLLATGLRVGAPAITDGGKGWLTDFMSRATTAGLRVDFVPVHYYRSYWTAADPDGATTQFYNFLKDIHDTVRRPLWVTEFNNGANWTSGPDPSYAQQAATVGRMIEMLDNTPFVERYAIYNWVEDVRRVVWDDGWPTAAGEVYRDKASPLSYRQEMADAGTGNSARYDFDGDAHDSWGHGQDAMMVGAPTFTTGRSGQAILLDGDDYLQLSPRIADTANFTFAAWIFWNGGGNWQRIFDFGADTSNYLALTPKAGSAGGLRFLMRNGGAEQQLNAPAPATGTWTHVAVTINGDTGKLFVNGLPVNTNTAMTIDPIDVGTRFNFLGRSQFSADPLFNGRIDDVRIVSSALTDAQVKAIVDTAPPRFSSTNLSKPTALRGQPYSASIAGDASGGVSPRTFSKMSGPAWLTVSPDGSLSGVPMTGDDPVCRAALRVTDAQGAIHAALLQIPVADLPGSSLRYGFDGHARASSGTADATAAGNPSYAAGRSGQAINLDGTDDHLRLPAGPASLAACTIATWIQWDGGGNWQRIFDFGNGGDECLFLTPRSAAGTLQFTIRNREDACTLETTAPPVGAWMHLAVTIGNGSASLFVNGIRAATASTALTPLSIDPASCFLGRSQFSADPSFDGRIDEFCIVSGTLTPSEIVALRAGLPPRFTADSALTRPDAMPGQPYNHSLALSAADPNAGTVFSFARVSGPAWLTVDPDGRISGLPSAADAGTNVFRVRVTDPSRYSADAELRIVVTPPPDVVAHYQFDGSFASTAGNAAAGTPNGSPSFTDGVFDRALVFDGTNDRVALAPNAAAGLGDATFAVRLRWHGGADWQRIFDFGSGENDYLMLTPSADTGTPQFAIRSAGGPVQRLSSPIALPENEWAHLAVTLSGSTGTLFLNGTAVASGAISIDPAAIPQTLCWLGDSQATGNRFLHGTVDDFRIYRRALPAAEIAALARPLPATAVALDYPGWTTGFAFPAGRHGSSDDPDGDGSANVFEFLAATHPLAAASVPTLTAGLAAGTDLGLSGPAADGLYLTLTATVRRDRPGLTLSAEGSDAAGQFSPAHAAPLPGIPAGGSMETLRWHHRLPSTAMPRASLRLRASLP